ncbi:uncharacterized protein EAE97_001745 [Botrytis byssoidea]|uniref:Uncharacterized protein n=1 Tax=Botrytis byssoidea TaxID=139641 RepID=A0A9P5M946_9HELO|nr:uncharacterized protein EAE97_001745 [Botrytis byssoidea]KAF7952248.1 hypothetical protein EAE97_001745 [Botrytis byssoidea]
MCYYLGNIWASCPDGYREYRCESPCNYGTIMHPCGVSSHQFIYVQSLAECPCPNCRFRRGPVPSVAQAIWMKILDQVTLRLEVKDLIVEMDGVEAVHVEVEVLGVQNAEALVVGEELKGVELEEVELEGVDAVQADSRPIKPDRIQEVPTDTMMIMGDEPVDLTQLTRSRVQAGKQMDPKADAVLED